MNNQTISSKNFLMPVFLKLEEMNVLLVGAGPVGVEKATAILSNSPKTNLTIVAELVSEEMHQLIADLPNVTLLQRKFDIKDLSNISILFLAVNNIALSAEIRSQAKQHQILVNVADTPSLCDFYLSSVVQKGHLKIAISTNGQSPTIAKRLREFLTDNLPDEIDDLLQNMNRLRETLKGDFQYKVKKLNELTSSLKSKTGD